MLRRQRRRKLLAAAVKSAHFEQAPTAVESKPGPTGDTTT
jgi:hypothetical protein